MLSRHQQIRLRRNRARPPARRLVTPFYLVFSLALLLCPGTAEPLLAAGKKDWGPGFFRLNPSQDRPFSGSPYQDRRDNRNRNDRGNDRWPPSQQGYDDRSRDGYQDPFARNRRDPYADFPTGKSRPWGEIPQELLNEERPSSSWPDEEPPAWRDRDPGYRSDWDRYDPDYRDRPRYRDYPPERGDAWRDRYPDPYYDYGDSYWSSPYEERYRRDRYRRGNPYWRYDGVDPWWIPGMDRLNYWDGWDPREASPRRPRSW